MKSDLGIRPVYHQMEHRVEAHILVASWLISNGDEEAAAALHAPGLTPRAALEKLAAMQMLDVSFPTTDGHRLLMPCYTELDPEPLLLHPLKFVLPQPLLLPRQLLSPTSKCS